ncbi:hypothetical protein, partial [Actinotalea sp.]|uniref:hypothetical protein n=1 Tax=Actinotalea sp. TaxID=1872145 RepID=UPI00356A1C51
RHCLASSSHAIESHRASTSAARSTALIAHLPRRTGRQMTRAFVFDHTLGSASFRDGPSWCSPPNIHDRLGIE